ncbi:MAG TPA: SBBP repeat-containing protein, partial [Planctomycetota bacterium]|nr:SBBP repeat-containing protein [Planctomycetota bacterium]
TTPGAFRTTGQRDGFIAKMREDGTGLLYATYLGGSGSEEVRGIAVDPGGGVAAVGWTLSTDFPVTAGAVQPTFGGTSQVLSIGDAFVAHLAPGGGSLLGATYLGGLLEESGEAVEIDASGAMTVAGWTSSPNFPVSAGAFQPNLHGPLTLQTDGFLARVSSDAHTLVFSTYFGGNFHDQLLGLKVDGLGTAFVVGWSGSANFPVTSNAYRTSIAGDDDIVVAHFSATGGLIWSTYLGGLGVDIGHAIALDSAGNVWIAGSTGSTNFPTTAGAGQRQLAGGRDGFLAELDNSGSSLLYGAYLGGPGDEIIRALAIEANGNKLLVGEASDGFPTTANALQPGFGGGSLDGLIIELDAAGSTVTFASYLGGVNEDVFGAVATSPGGSAVIAGWTWSPDWPTTVGAFQRSLHGIEDGCVLRLDTLSFGGRFAFGGGDDLGSTLFVPDTEVGMLALAVANQTSRPLWLDQVRVFVGGSADNLVDVADVSLWLDQPGTPGRTDLRLAGPVPLTGDHVIVELPVTGLPALQPGERQALTVTVRARAGCRPGAEIACSLLGQDGFVVHSDGLAGGAQVGMLGPELLTRAVACLRAPVFPGDFDGDGRITVADLRQLAMHLGEAAGAFDADGDGAVGVHDLELVGARILGLPVLRAQPTVVSRDSLLTLRGYDLAAITTATLGGRSLQLVAPSYGELTLRIDAGIAGGEQELLIQGRDRPLLQTTVQVQ